MVMHFFECSTGPVFYSGIENSEVVEFVANHGAKIGMKVRDECFYKNEVQLASISSMAALLKYGLDVKFVAEREYSIRWKILYGLTGVRNYHLEDVKTLMLCIICRIVRMKLIKNIILSMRNF